ncbi:MAG: PepSY domain-containing protein [Acidimicrobiia bacterium]
MSRTRKIIAGVAVGTAVLAAGTGVVLAKAAGDHEQPITGEELEKASAAALAHLGGGRVTGSELQDEEGYYEIEVTRADGRQVDVHLDRNFRVLNDVDDKDAGPDDAGPEE